VTFRLESPRHCEYFSACLDLLVCAAHKEESSLCADELRTSRSPTQRACDDPPSMTAAGGTSGVAGVGIDVDGADIVCAATASEANAVPVSDEQSNGASAMAGSSAVFSVTVNSSSSPTVSRTTSSITDVVAAERAPGDDTSSVRVAPRSVLPDALSVGDTQNQANGNAGNDSAVLREPLAQDSLAQDLPAPPQAAVHGNPLAADGEGTAESVQPPSLPKIERAVLAARSSPAAAAHAARSSGVATSTGTLLAAGASQTACARHAPTDLHDSSIGRSPCRKRSNAWAWALRCFTCCRDR